MLNREILGSSVYINRGPLIASLRPGYAYFATGGSDFNVFFLNKSFGVRAQLGDGVALSLRNIGGPTLELRHRVDTYSISHVLDRNHYTMEAKSPKITLMGNYIHEFIETSIINTNKKLSVGLKLAMRTEFIPVNCVSVIRYKVNENFAMQISGGFADLFIQFGAWLRHKAVEVACQVNTDHPFVEVGVKVNVGEKDSISVIGSSELKAVKYTHSFDPLSFDIACGFSDEMKVGVSFRIN